jgi:hypothetical protein
MELSSAGRSKLSSQWLRADPGRSLASEPGRRDRVGSAMRGARHLWPGTP